MNQPKKSTGRGRLKLFARVAIAILLLGLLFTFVVDFESFLAEVVRVSPWSIVGAAVSVTVGRLVIAWRWLLLVRSTHAETSFTELSRLTLMGTSLSFVGPGTVGTETYRVAGLARRTGVGTAVASVLVERLSALFGVAFIAGIGVAMGGLPMPDSLWYGLVALCTAIVLGSCLTMAAPFRRLFERLCALLPANLAQKLGGLLRAVGVYLARPGLLARVFLLAILLHLVRVAGAMAIAWGLGMQVGFTTLMIVISVGVILSMLPLTPQGLGTREIAYVAMLASLGVPAAQATALSLLFTGTTAVVVLLPTLWFYLRFGIWGNPAPVSRNDRSV